MQSSPKKIGKRMSNSKRSSIPESFDESDHSESQNSQVKSRKSYLSPSKNTRNQMIIEEQYGNNVAYNDNQEEVYNIRTEGSQERIQSKKSVSYSQISQISGTRKSTTHQRTSTLNAEQADVMANNLRQSLSSTKTVRTSQVRSSVVNSGLKGMRASNALQSIQAFQDKNKSVQKRASISLGIKEVQNEDDDNEQQKDMGMLRIENERLETTLMILNQKMRVHEDNDDLNDKWKSQVQSKDKQISIMNDQIESQQADSVKQRNKIKDLNSEVASLESKLHSSQSQHKQLKSNLENAEDEHAGSKSSYQKLFTQFNQLTKENSFSINEITELHQQIKQVEDENVELRELNSDHKDEINQFQRQLKETLNQVSEQEKQIQQLRDNENDLEADIADMEKEHGDNVSKITKDQQRLINNMLSDHQVAIDSLKDEHHHSHEELKLNHSETLDSHKLRHADEIDNHQKQKRLHLDEKLDEIKELHRDYKSQIQNMTSEHDSYSTEMTETHKSESQTLKLKITELETTISQLEDDNDGHLKHKSRIQRSLDELQLDNDTQIEHNNKLRSANTHLNNNMTDAGDTHEQQKTLIKQLENMKMELEEELEASEEQRESLKVDLENANHKIIELEEQLFESKTIQLELLENLKISEQQYEETIVTHETRYSEIEMQYKNKMQYLNEKVLEMNELVGKMEYTQCIYIAHKQCQIDVTLGNFINKYPERKRMQIMFLRESEGVYQFGQKRIYIKIEKGEKILVRVGGGYMGIEEFIRTYTQEEVDKIGRKNVALNYQEKSTVQKLASAMPEYARETSPIRESQKVDLPQSPWRIKTSPRKYAGDQSRMNNSTYNSSGSPTKTYSIYGGPVRKQSPSKTTPSRFGYDSPNKQNGSSQKWQQNSYQV